MWLDLKNYTCYGLGKGKEQTPNPWKYASITGLFEDKRSSALRMTVVIPRFSS